MKEVYSYQEIKTDIDQGEKEKVGFTAHPTVYVTAVRKSPESETISITLAIGIGPYEILVKEAVFRVSSTQVSSMRGCTPDGTCNTHLPLFHTYHARTIFSVVLVGRSVVSYAHF